MLASISYGDPAFALGSNRAFVEMPSGPQSARMYALRTIWRERRGGVGVRFLKLLLLLLGASCLVVVPAEQVHRTALVVWLIPSEPATPGAGIGGLSDCEAEAAPTGTLPDRIEEEIRGFNATRSRTRVTVINTQDPFAAQLIDWSPEMAVPNWVWVKSQTETLRALGRFADRNQIDIRVRFITWDRALSDLKATWEGKSAYDPPDVVQIGTTWAGYFQARNLLLTRPKWQINRNGWEDVEGTRACALPYVNDPRLIFYWSRLPGSSPNSPAFNLHTGSWQAIVDSLRAPRENGPPFAFPIGLTLNLLHDYASLVWAGGGDFLPEKWLLGRHLDLTSRPAFAVPAYLAENSVVFVNGRPQRLIAFPEASHEEVDRSFVQGLYRATMEPANFIGRWRRDFACRYPAQASSFWQYAAAAVPPSPFRGGSYLAVWSQTSFPSHAFELAEFLTEDEEYTHMLGVSGYLPARRPGGGVDLFLGSADVDGKAKEFEAAVQEVLSPRVGRSYPPIREFSAVMESRDLLERLQIAWRRLSERDPDGLRTALREAEKYVNREIYPPAHLYGAASEFAGFISTAMATIFLLLIVLNRRRVAALKQAAQVRGFSAAGALLIETVHSVFHNPAEIEGIGLTESTKGAMIIAALQGWRRGRDVKNWDAVHLGDVIWRSVMLALDSSLWLGIFRDWQQSKKRAPDYLQHWVNHPQERAGDSLKARVALAQLRLEVSYPPSRVQPMPFMLEQALVCLIQNAIKTVVDPDFDPDQARSISIQAHCDALVIANPGEPLSRELCDAINQSKTPEEFEERIGRILVTNPKGRPGFGLMEAYCIATQCFGGLRVCYDKPRFEIRLKPRSRWLSWGLFRKRRSETSVTTLIVAKEQPDQAHAE